MNQNKGYTLRFMISLLVIASVLLTATVSMYSSISSNKRSLTVNYLDYNHQYAEKLALETNTILSSMQQKLDAVAKLATHHSFTQEEVDLLLTANMHFFNSIFIVDSNRVIQHISPSNTGLTTGIQLNTDTAKLAVKLKKSFISNPYKATSGRLILLISSPIFKQDGTYAGFVGGTIYLEEDNVLSQMLSEHFYGNGSFVYVTDQDGNIIFHPDKRRINTSALSNSTVKKALSGRSGSQQVRNSKGKEYFMGYAYEPNTGWGIVSQTPVTVLKQPLNELIVQMILKSLPLFILILLISWLLAYRISKPLHVLAKGSEEAIRRNKQIPAQPKMSSGIYEVKQLYKHINNHIELLNRENQIDGLTELANRKTFQRVIEEWVDNGISFSLILLDVDHFKTINDEYGHVTGDEVLKSIASTIRLFTRDGDLNFRYGGEEFGILVKDANKGTAFKIAEQVRTAVEKCRTPSGRNITISLGISEFINETSNTDEIIKKADYALYQSKSNGRNVTTIYKG
ncbi:sensor domain-containing diguanylate cyclase [Bacillus sp. V5-8f]|uniref:sensor domain-containing diguanylate cyclase n=1 Tax=Bacillus sp. V5-8f TaxID=2053044 RepID=UPI00215535F4|nr:sensor domain-containing diguanylate cyclase [Bacillus sp. V5-8f]